MNRKWIIVAFVPTLHAQLQEYTVTRLPIPSHTQLIAGSSVLPPPYAHAAFAQRSLMGESGNVRTAFQNHEFLTPTMRFNANFHIKNPRYKRMGSGRTFGDLWERIGYVISEGGQIAREQGEYSAFTCFTPDKHTYGPVGAQVSYSYQRDPRRVLLRRLQRPVQGVAWKEFGPDFKSLFKKMFLH
jgi:hypothetical protein